jgi:uncharacterized protein (TIGR03083 family)
MSGGGPTPEQIAHSEAYRTTRERIGELVRDASPSTLDAIAPATPQWRARDVVAHLVGVATDVVNGNVTDAGGDDWTAVQVDARRDRSLDELLDEWADSGRRVDAFVLALPTAITGQLIIDTVTHEHDLRHAFGAPGARDSQALDLGLAWVVAVLGQMYDGAGEPALHFGHDGRESISGTGEPAITLRASTFELARAMTGRRTLDEIRAYDWSPAAAPERLLALPPFTARGDSLDE